MKIAGGLPRKLQQNNKERTVLNGIDKIAFENFKLWTYDMQNKVILVPSEEGRNKRSYSVQEGTWFLCGDQVELASDKIVFVCFTLRLLL